jgi:aspartyl-tRNA(Asn)/glutamyl-tRNA(Gln) amidotransferase subunit A
MVDAELIYTPAHKLAELIAARKLSPLTLVDAVIARAEQVNPRLNCFATKLFEQAREAARRAEDDVMRNRPLGPLHGVPITVKDGVATAGHPMTCGSYAMADFIAPNDSVVWQRLTAAGAILLGKTATPEFFHKVLTDSLIYGITRNPWSLDHTPGGSSGGAAACLATGIGPLAVGTDGGGSIRCPASCAGVLGLKPTLGRVPHDGFADTFGNYSFVGPMARDVRDMEIMLAVMSGPDAIDAHSLSVPPFLLGAARPPSVRGLRVAWMPRFGGAQVEAEVATLTGQAMRLIESDGAVVSEFSDPAFDDAFETYVVIATSAHAGRLGHFVARFGERMTESLKASIAQGAGYLAPDLVRAVDRRTALYRHVQPLFDRFDVLAMPTLTAPPKPVDAGGAINTPMYAEWARTLYPFNLTGNPAASAPCGFTRGGLPVGLQLVAPWYEERRIIEVAAFLEAASPWASRRPPL